MSLLALQNVSKSFGGRQVLQNVNLEVRSGEFVAIVGYSGSGKSTLMSLLAGLIRPDSGHVLFEGRSVTRWGMVEGPIDYESIAKQVMRPDLYEEAMKEIGYVHGGPSMTPETLFDGVTFDPAKPEEYAASFAVKNLKG